MMVSFSNTDVPIYKLRLGTVVSWEVSQIYYGHIIGIFIREGYVPMLTIALNRDKHIVLKATEITWLEPY